MENHHAMGKLTISTGPFSIAMLYKFPEGSVKNPNEVGFL